MFLPAPSRSDAPELMDRTDNPPAVVEHALADLRRANRWLGGRRTLVSALRPLLLEAPADRHLTLLDVGTGSADLPLVVAAQARRLGRRVTVVAVDRGSHVAAIAARLTRHSPDVRVLRADAFALPFREAAFDIVTASLFLHHFRDADVVRLLTRFRALARRAVVINDLRRHWLPWGFLHVAGRLTLRNRLFVHDGPLSVLRGFTAAELAAAARRAGAGTIAVERRWPFHLALTLDGCR